MEISICKARTKLSKLVQLLIDGKEDSITITKNGKPVVQLSPISKKNSKRIGIAKNEMKDFNISLEEFNSISTEDFGI